MHLGMFSPGMPTEPHVAVAVTLIAGSQSTGVAAGTQITVLQDKEAFMAVCSELYDRVRANYLPMEAEEIMKAFDDRGGFKVRKLK